MTQRLRDITRPVRLYQDRYARLLDLSTEQGIPLHDAMELVFRKAEKAEACEGMLAKKEGELKRLEERIEKVEKKAGVKLEQIFK